MLRRQLKQTPNYYCTVPRLRRAASGAMCMPSALADWEACRASGCVTRFYQRPPSLFLPFNGDRAGLFAVAFDVDAVARGGQFVAGQSFGPLDERDGVEVCETFVEANGGEAV